MADVNETAQALAKLRRVIDDYSVAWGIDHGALADYFESTIAQQAERIAELEAEFAREQELRGWFAEHLEKAALAIGALDVPFGGYNPELVARKAARARATIAKLEADRDALRSALEWAARNIFGSAPIGTARIATCTCARFQWSA